MLTAPITSSLLSRIGKTLTSARRRLPLGCSQITSAFRTVPPFLITTEGGASSCVSSTPEGQQRRWDPQYFSEAPKDGVRPQAAIAVLLHLTTVPSFSRTY